MSSQYPNDEFDDLPEDGPVGVHRQPRSPWQTVLPFLIALLVAPLLAWGAIALIKGGDASTAKPSNDSETTQSAPSQSGESQQSEDAVSPVTPLPEDGPTGAPDNPLDTETSEPETPEAETPAVEGEVDFAASISVLNGTGVQGLAAQKVAVLTEAGFTAATAGNADNSGTMEDTIFYRDASMHATAVRVGEALGISNVVENAEAVGGSQVVALIRTS